MGAVSDSAGRLEEGELRVCTPASLCDCMCVCVCAHVSLKGWMCAKGESNTMSEC